MAACVCFFGLQRINDGDTYDKKKKWKDQISGGAAVPFSMFKGRIDRKWCKIFVAYGVNAITVFFLSAIIAKVMGLIKIYSNGEEVSSRTWLYDTFFTSWLPADIASLAWAITFVLFFLLLLWPMYRKNLIIKV